MPHHTDKNCRVTEGDHRQKRYRIRLLGNHFLLLMTLIIGLTTTIGTLYVIIRLKLTKDFGVMRLIDNDGIEELLINQDLTTNTFIPMRELRLEKIVAKSIKISSSLNQRDGQAEINVDQDTISMQAETFSSGVDNRNYQFRIQKDVNILEVPDSIRNIKSIRAPSSGQLLPEYSQKAVGLEVKSSGKLELSGNMGLRVHSRNMDIKSPGPLSIESKEGSVTISTYDGLYIPNLQHKNNEEQLRKRLNITEQSIESPSQGAGYDYQLCISRDDGNVFRALGHCSQHPA